MAVGHSNSTPSFVSKLLAAIALRAWPFALIGWLPIAAVLSGCDSATDVKEVNAGTLVRDSTPGDSRSPGRRVALRHEFGLVTTSEPLRHVFEIRNDSDTNWTLKEIRPSCACTVPSISATMIEPGAAARAEVLYYPGNSVGDWIKPIDILFREEEAPVVRLIVTARIRTPLTVLPPMVEIQAAGGSQQIRHRVRVHNYTDQAWKTCVMINLMLTCVKDEEDEPDDADTHRQQQEEGFPCSAM